MRKRQIGAMMLAVMLLTVFSIGVMQAKEAAVRASDIIKNVEATLDPTGGSAMKAGAQIKGNGICDIIGISRITIQEKRGTSWVGVYSQACGSKTNASSYSASISWTGQPGRTYRAVAYCFAKKGGVTSSAAARSSSLVLP